MSDYEDNSEGFVDMLIYWLNPTTIRGWLLTGLLAAAVIQSLL